MSPRYRNQTDTIKMPISEVDSNNSEIDIKCIVEPDKRKACGAKHYTREFCNALQCCWFPMLDDPSVPPCYFSRLQMEDAAKVSTLPPEMEQLTTTEESEPEKYNALHEGKVVSWDESIENKPKSDTPQGWDEALGAGADEGDSQSIPLPTQHPLTVDEQNMGDSTERPLTTEEEPAFTPQTEPKTDQPTEEPLAVTTSPHQVVKKEGQVNESSLEDKHKKDSTIVEDKIGKSDTQEQKTLKDKHKKDSTMVEDKTGKSDPQEQKTLMQDSGMAKGGNAQTQPPKDMAMEEVDENRQESLDSEVSETEDELHVESFWLRLLIVLSDVPHDIIYILEPIFDVWISLLPKEYQNDVHGVSWTIILSTFFIGFALIWLLTCRSRSVKRRKKDEQSSHTIQELKTQLETLSQDKIEVENELRTKENEVEIQREQMETVSREKEAVAAQKRGLEHSVQESSTENEALKIEVQRLSQSTEEKEQAMQEVLANSQEVKKSLVAQQEAIKRYEVEISWLQKSIEKSENSKKEVENSSEKLKERIKNLEKTKGESKKEGKVLKEQIDKLNATIGELQKALDTQTEEDEQKRQEIDVLKDCILQFKGAQEQLADEGEDAESEESIEKQKGKMKSMLDVANVKAMLRQSEADKLQITYELEAERQSKVDVENKISELEAMMQSEKAVKEKLERDRQTLESKLSVMQEFYTKREVEIQSKLGLEESRRESNASLLEDQQKQQLELREQITVYKKMSEEAKHKYDDAERKHKQEMMGFEKKAHDNWLACREAERKFEEANKQISQLQLELGDARMRLRESDRDAIIRPRPERHGPPGGPPPFGPPRRPPPPGVPRSPLHFRNGPPPDGDRRSPPPHRRPPSPHGSIPGDRPPSRPDRPPSTHSLPPMDRRPPGPPIGPGQPYSNTPGRDGRPYREGMPPDGRPPFRDGGMPPLRPPLHELPTHGRPLPGPGSRIPASGPLTSSPYMDRPTIPPSQSPGPRSQNFTQSSLHATPPHPMGEGLRNDGYQPPPPPDPATTGPPPPGPGKGQGSSNPFRRSRT